MSINHADDDFVSLSSPFAQYIVQATLATETDLLCFCSAYLQSSGAPMAGGSSALGAVDPAGQPFNKLPEGYYDAVGRPYLRPYTEHSTMTSS